MSNQSIRAPIGRILPSFVPVILERGIPGYTTEPLAVEEIRIPAGQLRPLLVAAAFVGTWAHAGERGFDSDAVRELLTQSIYSVSDLGPSEAEVAIELVERFMTFKIIRAEHSLDDWLCEALWPAFQAAPYRYPSAMSHVITYALNINDTLRKIVLEY